MGSLGCSTDIKKLGLLLFFMKPKFLILITAVTLIFTGLIAPANANSSISSAAGVKCINKDLVAGVCLPKNRKKWSKSYENNFMLSCLGTATESWAPDLKSAGAYCGCAVVEMEKVQTQSAMIKAEQLYAATGQMPQKWTNAIANCAQYLK
jgi:hypothetical protein